MANETIAIPQDLARRRRKKGWPLDLVQQALASGAQRTISRRTWNRA